MSEGLTAVNPSAVPTNSTNTAAKAFACGLIASRTPVWMRLDPSPALARCSVACPKRPRRAENGGSDIGLQSTSPTSYVCISRSPRCLLAPHLTAHFWSLSPCSLCSPQPLSRFPSLLHTFLSSKRVVHHWRKDKTHRQPTENDRHQDQNGSIHPRSLGNIRTGAHKIQRDVSKTCHQWVPWWKTSRGSTAEVRPPPTNTRASVDSGRRRCRREVVREGDGWMYILLV